MIMIRERDVLGKHNMVKRKGRNQSIVEENECLLYRNAYIIIKKKVQLWTIQFQILVCSKLFNPKKKKRKRKLNQ